MPMMTLARSPLIYWDSWTVHHCKISLVAVKDCGEDSGAGLPLLFPLLMCVLSLDKDLIFYESRVIFALLFSTYW